MERLKEMLTSTVIVKICLDNSHIIFDMGDITLVSRLIEGEYPDYEKVIPVRERHKADDGYEDASFP